MLSVCAIAEFLYRRPLRSRLPTNSKGEVQKNLALTLLSYVLELCSLSGSVSSSCSLAYANALEACDLTASRLDDLTDRGLWVTSKWLIN